MRDVALALFLEEYQKILDHRQFRLFGDLVDIYNHYDYTDLYATLRFLDEEVLVALIYPLRSRSFEYSDPRFVENIFEFLTVRPDR